MFARGLSLASFQEAAPILVLGLAALAAVAGASFLGFEDKAEAAGVKGCSMDASCSAAGSGYGHNKRGFAWGDYNNDGYVDIFNAQDDFGPNILYKNVPDTVNGGRKFVDALVEANMDGGFGVTTWDASIIGSHAKGRAGSWGDYDADGDLDLYVGDEKQNVLFQNQGDGTFLVKTEEAGVLGTPSMFVYDVAWGDYDGDGHLDMFLAHGGSGVSLFKNKGDGTFNDVTSSLPFDVSGAYDMCMSARWADYDGDGDLDIFIPMLQSADILFRNNGDGTFTDVASEAGVDKNYESASCAWADYNGDGLPDLYVPRSMDAGCDGNSASTCKNSLFKNNGGTPVTFTDVASSVGVDMAGIKGWSAAWADMDGDGDQDLCVGTKSQSYINRLFQNNGGSSFTDIASSAGFEDDASKQTMGVGWADYDNNGAMDLFLTNEYKGNNLYWNKDTTAAGRGYFVRPVDSGKTHTALTLGGTVSVFAAGSTMRIHGSGAVWIDGGGGGYAGQNDFDAFFALQDADALVDIEVRYPNPKLCSAKMLNVKPSEDFEDKFGRRVFSLVTPRFVDTTSCAGVEGAAISHGAAWADYDGDGDIDVVATTNAAPLLYRNDGNGVFVDAATNAGLTSITNVAVAWGDYDGDGDPDLYAGGNSGGKLFRNKGNGKFDVDSSAYSVACATGGNKKAASWADYNDARKISHYTFLTAKALRCYSLDLWMLIVAQCSAIFHGRTATSTSSSCATGRSRTFSCKMMEMGPSPTKRARPAWTPPSTRTASFGSMSTMTATSTFTWSILEQMWPTSCSATTATGPSRPSLPTPLPAMWPVHTAPLMPTTTETETRTYLWQTTAPQVSSSATTGPPTSAPSRTSPRPRS